MLKTEMKSKTDKQTWEKQTQNQRATKTEVDNGVQPLHWATSPDPFSNGYQSN